MKVINCCCRLPGRISGYTILAFSYKIELQRSILAIRSKLQDIRFELTSHFRTIYYLLLSGVVAAQGTMQASYPLSYLIFYALVSSE
jgi:hypothetical protein